MANKRRWSRYQPPAEKRDETGQPVKASSRTRSKARSEARSQSTRPARVMPPKPAAKPKPKAKPKSGWIGLGTAAIILVIIVGIVAAVRGSDDDSSTTDVDRSLLNEEFIDSSLTKALEIEGKDAVSLSLSEYNMTVEYFDPNTRESRYFETDDYTDGYTVRVEDSYYDDYQPRPFDLSTIDATTLIDAVEDALTKTDDIYTYSLRVEADRDSGEVSMVVSVSGDDSVEITTAP